MSQLGRIKPKYLTISVSNKTTSTIDAVINQMYEINVIGKLDNYVVCIERMELNLNAIPFYKAYPNDDGKFEFISFNLRSDIANVPDGTALETINLTDNYYSLYDVLTSLSKKTRVLTMDQALQFNTLPNPVTEVVWDWGLDPVGRIILNVKKSDDTSFRYWYPNFTTCPRMAEILGLSQDLFTSLGANTNVDQVQSKYPQIDCGDFLNHILLTSSLPVLMDSIDVIQSNVLTDICPLTSYSPNTAIEDQEVCNLLPSTWSLHTRQKLIYVPQQRRYLDLIAPFGLRYINIEARYIDNNKTSRVVPLPPGGTFQVKLGFYMK